MIIFDYKVKVEVNKSLCVDVIRGVCGELDFWFDNINKFMKITKNGELVLYKKILKEY